MATVVMTSWKSDGMPLGTVETPEESVAVYTFTTTVKSSPNYTEVFPAVYAQQWTPPAPAEPKPFDRELARVTRDKALAYVNVARTALGYRPLDDLPMGHRGNANQCVLARAIPGTVSVGGNVSFIHERLAAKVAAAWCVPAHGRVVSNPAGLSEFVMRFDGGQYPDLTL